MQPSKNHNFTTLLSLIPIKMAHFLKKIMLLAGVFFLATALNSCSDDDSDAQGEPEPQGTITITEEEQVISQNTPVIDLVNANTDVWLVARHTDASGEILGQKLLAAGNRHEIPLLLQGTELMDGDAIHLMLYADDAVGMGDGIFEEGTDDLPITGVSKTLVVRSPGFTISDAAVVENTIIFDNVTVAERGWIVLYNGNPNISSSGIIGYTMVEESENNVVVELNESYRAGDQLFARLHAETEGNRQFSYPEVVWTHQTDSPEFFGFEEDNTIWMKLETD
ncbi:DUF7282 domain-containing protein [Salinimicrobium sp. CAU 1759]